MRSKRLQVRKGDTSRGKKNEERKKKGVLDLVMGQNRATKQIVQKPKGEPMVGQTRARGSSEIPSIWLKLRRSL